MPDEKPQLPKPAREMTTEEAMRFMFPEAVVDHAKELTQRPKPSKPSTEE